MADQASLSRVLAALYEMGLTLIAMKWLSNGS
jgi:hypothetical protein